MERYASTLAVTAACVGLLLTAHQHIVSQRETVSPKPVAAKSVAVASAPAQAWVEPPLKTETVAAAPAAAPAPVAAVETAPAPEPAVAVPLAPVLAAATPTQHAALRPERTKRAEQAARARKLAQARERRMRMAARAVPAEASADRSQAAVPSAPAEKRIDPIGDLLRGLGIGREG